MKLNIGCGYNKRDGYINVDRSPHCAPDVIMDLEHPWPFEDGSVQEIRANHVLEHIANFKQVVQEIYRVLPIGGQIHINVPHPHCDDFITDPTHVTAILPATLALLSKKNCAHYRKGGFANSPLADMWDVDMEVRRIDYLLLEPWRTMRTDNSMSDDEIMGAMMQFNNVCQEMYFLWEKAS